MTMCARTMIKNEQMTGKRCDFRETKFHRESILFEEHRDALRR